MINKDDIDHGKAFDWGNTSKNYAKYRDIYPSEFYQKLIEMGLCTAGQTVLDLGTGTGVLPRNLYPYGAKFIGADISAQQIEEARRLSAQDGMDIEYIVSSAEALNFPDESFDTVTACQCFMYFDKTVLLPKVYRMLKKDGHFCILFMAWLPDESEIAEHSESLVLKYNPAWTGGGMQRYPLNTPEWSRELFVVDDAITCDFDIAFTRESWHGRMKACRGTGASSLPPAVIAAFEAEHLAYMNTIPDVFDIKHYATMLNLRKRSI